MPTRTAITLYTDNDVTIPGTVTSDGAALDLTGATVALEIREARAAAAVAATFAGTITDAVGGAYEVAIEADQLPDPGVYWYRINVDTAAGADLVPNHGPLVIERS